MGCDSSPPNPRIGAPPECEQRENAHSKQMRTAEDNWLTPSGYQIDGSRKAVGPHEKRTATSFSTPPTNRRPTTVVPVTGARYDPCSTPAGHPRQTAAREK